MRPRLSKLQKLGRPITPRDLRNPKGKTGYSYVQGDGSKTKPFQAFSYRSGGGRTRPAEFLGSRRASAIESAQDFCDWFNGTPMNVPPALAAAGHEYTVDETDRDPEYQAALGVMRDRKAQRSGKQGYVYLIVEDVKPRRGCVVRPMFGKIGYSTNPQKRVAELQTGNPRLLKLYATIKGTEESERLIHARHIEDNVLQEWFRLTDAVLSEFKVNELREAA